MNPPCFIDDMDEQVYHADPCQTPSLSASIATKIVTQSPLHGYMAHPKLGNYREDASPEMDVGTMIHASLLGQTLNVTLIDAKDFRTNAAKQSRDDALEAGSIPVLAHKYEDLLIVSKEIGPALTDKNIDLTGKSERVAIWQEETPSGLILCRGMMDHTILEETPRPIVYDLKTCHSAHPEAVRKHITAYGYDIQRAAYLSAIEKIYPDLAGRVLYQWVFIEILPPEAPKRVIITVAEASGSMRELGERRWQTACNTWAYCLKTDHWPDYSSVVLQVEARNWELEQYT